MTPVCGALPWLIYTYFIYFNTDLRSDAFELPFPMWYAKWKKTEKLFKFFKSMLFNGSKIKRLPFDWRNPYGFMIALGIQYVMFLYMAMIGGNIFILPVGSFLYAIAMTKCIKGSLFAIGRSGDTNQTTGPILEQLAEFIEFHSHVKQLSDGIECFSLLNFVHFGIMICAHTNDTFI